MIEVVDYDASWPSRFAELQDHYEQALTDIPIVSIEHVGSTSIPGLPAKPILDIDIVVLPEDVEDAIAAMEAIGFTRVGTRGIDDRWALDEPADLAPTNTYVIVEGSLALRNHLGVRDALRSDDVLREEYGRIKRAIAADASGIAEYTERKSAFLSSVLARAGLTSAELQAIEESNRAS